MTQSQQMEAGNSIPHQIMHGFTQLLLEGKLEQWLELYTSEAIFEFPYAPAGYPQKLEGKAEITNHLHNLLGMIEIQQFSEPVILADSTKQQFVAEFTCKGRSLVTGKPYNQTYISVVRHSNGKITHYKDYWNPMVVLESDLGGNKHDQ
ncbi:nuclear transport factor 2 family protein [Paenibacillus sp. W2I17]|uniref:nuclear transport factor 2 family protein n=1 Tax=Paenibacillus sp. W2I17 TaxID=3042311 RepID=UPI002783A3D6|nr:nuclear transport factor 2 family protein [Paenibacillus sp. W2I17]MDQ0656733.1 ketosteroid isomerase-like protein [Paenibacillus sp. W2I17]